MMKGNYPLNYVIGIDETAAQSYMARNTNVYVTVAKDMHIKSNGSKKIPVRVCLTAIVFWFVNFKGVKHKAAVLNYTVV